MFAQQATRLYKESRTQRVIGEVQKMRRRFPVSTLMIAAFLSACGGDRSAVLPPSPQFGEFTNPQRVTIRGYSDHAMEPFISRDNRYLFFNNLNDPAVNTNLHWAERVDDLTFQYQGEIEGVNTTFLEGVPSEDNNNVFYFISTRSYPQTLSTVYRGTFANGTVSGVELVPGIPASGPGMVIFDTGISPDGNTFYFAEGLYAPDLKSANIVIAERSGTGFTRASNSATILQQVNVVGGIQYAVAVSASGLELFFNRLYGTSPAIYTATRASTSAPFGTPRLIQAIAGFVEAPTLTPDEKSLYYHKLENNQFVIFRVTRP
jgi:hypothetical protein